MINRTESHLLFCLTVEKLLNWLPLFAYSPGFPVHQISRGYEIPCAEQPESYIGGTRRSFGICLKKHQKETLEKFALKPHTLSTRKFSVTEHNQRLHIMLLQLLTTAAAKVIDSESLKTTKCPGRPFGFAEKKSKRGEKTLKTKVRVYKLSNIFNGSLPEKVGQVVILGYSDHPFIKMISTFLVGVKMQANVNPSNGKHLLNYPVGYITKCKRTFLSWMMTKLNLFWFGQNNNCHKLIDRIHKT